ncbi:MAG: histidine kinase dimerization/phosphoacceptor domain -containing protein [Cyanobacteria bacterium P01_A01_bin.114]
MNCPSPGFIQQYQQALAAYLDKTPRLDDLLPRLSTQARQQQMTASDWVSVHRQVTEQLAQARANQAKNSLEIAHQASVFLQQCLELWEQPAASATPTIDQALKTSALNPTGLKAQLAREIQKRQAAEKSLREHQARFNKLSANIPGMLFQCIRMVDGSEFLTYVSSRCRDILELEPRMLQKFSTVLDQLPQAAASYFRTLMNRSATNLSDLFWEGTFETRSHQLKWLQIMAQPSRTAEGEIIWDGVLFDITARKKAELEREQQAEQFQNLVANVPGIIYRCIAMPGFPIEFISGAITTVTGYPVHSSDQASFQSLDEITYPDDQLMVQATVDRAIENDAPYQIEYRIMTADGEPRWVLERGRSTWNPKTKQHHIDGVIIDINDLKLAEAQVKASLTEKEVLLREVHHRVKNNLNVVHSMLEMQNRQAKNPELQTLLADSQQRLQVMALIHEQLYQSEQLAQINFADYISGLVQNFSLMVNPAASQVQLQLAVEPVWLTLETAIPVGLILNELLTNALKHAFHSQQSGLVNIIFERRDQSLHLAVCDDGVGLPDSFQTGYQSSLGLRLVSILADQIDATLQITSTQGAQFHLTFDAQTGQSNQPRRMPANGRHPQSFNC